jgi:hypothetical protein
MRQRMAVVFKYTVYALLVANVALLFRAAGADEFVPYKAVDQVGWLLILGVFEWETRQPGGDGRRRVGGWPMAAELLGYAFALFALVNYIADRITIDIVNAIAWLAISAMIWLDILAPVAADSAVHRRRTRAKALLYAAVFGCAVLWGIEGALLDFYDAALWILCFFAIEMNLLRIEPPRRLAAR